MNYKFKNKGFTLIELMIVISIISLLSSVVISSLSTARMNARDAKRISDIRQMRIALELYQNANGNYPVYAGWATQQGGVGWSILQTALAPYMPRLPVDPINNGADPWTGGVYAYAYYFDSSITSKYDLVAQLENQSSALRCATKQWLFYAGYPPSGSSWCGIYSSNIYTGEY